MCLLIFGRQDSAAFVRFCVQCSFDAHMRHCNYRQSCQSHFVLRVLFFGSVTYLLSPRCQEGATYFLLCFMLQNRRMSPDGCKVLNCQSRIYCLNYGEHDLNGMLSNIFLFHSFMLDQYQMLWQEKMFVTVALLLFDSLF